MARDLLVWCAKESLLPGWLRPIFGIRARQGETDCDDAVPALGKYFAAMHVGNGANNGQPQAMVVNRVFAFFADAVKTVEDVVQIVFGNIGTAVLDAQDGFAAADEYFDGNVGFGCSVLDGVGQQVGYGSFEQGCFR